MIKDFYTIMREIIDRDDPLEYPDKREIFAMELTDEIPMDDAVIFTNNEMSHFILTEYTDDKQHYKIVCYGELKEPEDLRINWRPDKSFWIGSMRNYLDMLDQYCRIIKEKIL